MITDTKFNLENLLIFEIKKSTSAHELIKEKYLPVQESLSNLSSLNLNYIHGDIEKFTTSSRLNLIQNTTDNLKEQADALWLFIKVTRVYLELFIETKKDENLEEWVLEDYLSILLTKAMKEYINIVLFLEDHEYDYRHI